MFNPDYLFVKWERREYVCVAIAPVFYVSKRMGLKLGQFFYFRATLSDLLFFLPVLVYL